LRIVNERKPVASDRAALTIVGDDVRRLYMDFRRRSLIRNVFKVRDYGVSLRRLLQSGVAFAECAAQLVSSSANPKKLSHSHGLEPPPRATRRL
jgi:hypothetical protein